MSIFRRIRALTTVTFYTFVTPYTKRWDISLLCEILKSKRIKAEALISMGAPKNQEKYLREREKIV